MVAVANLEDGGLENDLREVLSSWIARKEAIPNRWKGNVKPMCVILHNHGTLRRF